MVLVLALVASATAMAYFLERQGRPPREWAPYLLHRAEGHRPAITHSTAFVAELLERMDRIPDVSASGSPTWVGASEDASTTTDVNPAERRRPIGSIQLLEAAVGSAMPGDIIELLPGHYRIESVIYISRPGRPDAPVTLRAARLGSVVLESAVTEAIKVDATHWHFENLVMRGLCAPQDDDNCEHAFHIVGRANGTVIHNNRLVDFNAQIKINGENGRFPDNGLIDHNTLTDSRPRSTANPVTPIDLDAGSNWLITGNLMADFIKADGDRISYGAYAKAAGENNVFERNLVLCEDRLGHQRGQRIGLSLGGGGSGTAYRRDAGRSGLEHDNGRISDNLIAYCSDAGIYINRARRSRIEHNTILDTAGIEVRFPQSSAEIEGNVIDGVIAVREDALIHTEANDEAFLLGLFVGWHPQRSLFADVARLDLRWRGSPPRSPIPHPRPDLCGASRGPNPAIGAFEDFALCLSRGK